MKIIVGLGNPGRDYQMTRHNVGFMALEKLAAHFGDEASPFDLESKFKASISNTFHFKEKVLLSKPQTFMNKSGDSVKTLISFYKIDPKEDLIIVYDDIDLEIGTFKTSGKSSAGHKGMESVIKSLGANEIKRVRIGINSDLKGKKPTEAFVLEKLTEDELKKLEKEVFPKIIEYLVAEIEG